jgi:hypothetical protein
MNIQLENGKSSSLRTFFEYFWYHSGHIYIKEQLVGENGTSSQSSHFQVEFQVWYHSDHIYIKEQLVGENGTKNIQRKF